MRFNIDAPKVRDERGQLAYRHDQDDAPDAQLSRLLTAFTGRDVPADAIAMSDNGRLVRMDMNPSDVEVTGAVRGPGLIGSLDGGFAADIAAPVRKVRQQFGTLQNMVTSSDLTKLTRAMGGAPGAQPLRANPHLVSTQFNCREYALDASVPQEVLQNADRDLASALGSYARSLFQLTREFRVAQLLTTPGSFPAASQITPTALWSNSSTGNPVGDIFRALAKCKNPRPNTIVMAEGVAQYLGSTTSERIFLTEWLRKELGLNIVIATAKFTSGGSVADVWGVNGNNVVLCRTAPFDSGELTTAATARWSGDENIAPPREEKWVFVQNVLLRTFWNRAVGARGLYGCILVCNEDVVMIDNALGAIIVGVA